MKKRILTVALCFCMMAVLGATPAAAAGHPFRDVSDSHWANEAVSYVYNQGLMNGTGTQAFSLNGNLTRAMFVTILGRTSGMIESEYTGTSYSDIAPGQWYSPYVEWASCWNIAGGYGNGRFGPNDLVTREQMAAMIARYVDSYGIELEESSEAVDNFQDEYAVSPWAEEGVDLMRRTGILSGYGDGTFAPKQTATRAEAAIMVMRLTSLLGWDETPEEPTGEDTEEQALVNCIGMTVEQVSDIYGKNYIYDTWWFLGDLKGIVYKDGRVPAIFYFKDEMMKGESDGTDRIVAIEILENVSATCAVTDQISSKTTYAQIKSLGLSGTFEDGPNGEVNSGYGESSVFWHQDENGNTFKFAWCDGANPNTTNAWIIIFGPQCGFDPF